MRAYGHTSCASSFFGAMGLAWQALGAVSGKSTTADDYADKLLSGVVSGTLAAAEQTGSWDPAMAKTWAVESGDGWRLTGVKQFVPAAEGLLDRLGI